MWNAYTQQGVLNDYDLSRHRVDGHVERQGEERTATIPFLALDLLDPDFFAGKIPLEYRHEAESLKWAFLYFVCKNAPTNSDGTSVHDWMTNSPVNCRRAKLDFVRQRISVAPSYEAYQGLADILGDSIHEADFARTKARKSAMRAVRPTHPVPLEPLPPTPQDTINKQEFDSFEQLVRDSTPRL